MWLRVVYGPWMPSVWVFPTRRISGFSVVPTSRRRVGTNNASPDGWPLRVWLRAMKAHSACSGLLLHACNQSLACCIDCSLSVLLPRVLDAVSLPCGLGDMMKSLAFRLTALYVDPSCRLKSAEHGPTMNDRRPVRFSTLTGSLGQISTSRCQILGGCFLPVRLPAVVLYAESVAIVSFKIVEQRVHSRWSGTSHAHCSMSNLCPVRNVFHVPGAKNSALQRLQIISQKHVSESKEDCQSLMVLQQTHSRCG